MTKTAKDILADLLAQTKVAVDSRDGNAWDEAVDQALKELEAIHQQEIAKASSDITANQLLNHIADGMRYDETFTYTEIEEALETLKQLKENYEAKH